MPDPHDEPGAPRPALPVEIEVYVEPDGSVVFADLAAGAQPLADALAPPDSPAEPAPEDDPLD